jgi:hypothetical protein
MLRFMDEDPLGCAFENKNDDGEDQLHTPRLFAVGKEIVLLAAWRAAQGPCTP